MQTVKSAFSELMNSFGPYVHEAFVANVTSRSGGMEYAGAAVTSLGALSHEIFHSWIGRGVMPADGNAGAIDEMIALWRGNFADYGTWNGALSYIKANLGNYGPYSRGCPNTVYSTSRKTLGYLEYLLSARGLSLLPMLAQFYRDNLLKPVTMSQFEKHMKKSICGEENGQPLDCLINLSIAPTLTVRGFFDSYVYGVPTVPAPAW